MPLSYQDQIGHTIVLNGVPKRIVSLVPSQTELLFDLGLANSIAGRTKFCIHPEKSIKSIPDVGGTKTLKLNKIREIKPDLILANKEENKKSHIEELYNDFQVWTSDVKNLEDSLELIRHLSDIFQCRERGTKLRLKIMGEWHSLKTRQADHGSAAYLIWYRPWMTVGRDTFIHAMMNLAGFKNVYRTDQRYPTIDPVDLQSKKPDYILLSSEPFPFREKHKKELAGYLPESKIIFVDGEAFSWYGSRLLHSIPYFLRLANEISQ